MNQTLHRTSLLFAATVLILLLGWALRVHAIEARSFWADEGWTMLLSEGPGLGDVTPPTSTRRCSSRRFGCGAARRAIASSPRGPSAR